MKASLMHLNLLAWVLFSISELWHLDSKSGDVLRPPGEPRNDHRLGFGI